MLCKLKNTLTCENSTRFTCNSSISVCKKREILACSCFFLLAQRAKRATKSDTLRHCLATCAGQAPGSGCCYCIALDQSDRKGMAMIFP